MTETDIILRAGVPYSRRFRVLGATSVWPTLADFEVRSQVRARRSPESELRLNLAQYITMTIEGADIVGDIVLTGAQTYDLTTGHYDVVLSDPGSADARLIPVLSGDFKVLPRLVTRPL